MLAKSSKLLLSRFYPKTRPCFNILGSEKILFISINQLACKKKNWWFFFFKGLLPFLNCHGILTELTLFLYMVSHVDSAFLNLFYSNVLIYM